MAQPKRGEAYQKWLGWRSLQEGFDDNAIDYFQQRGCAAASGPRTDSAICLQCGRKVGMCLIQHVRYVKPMFPAFRSGEKEEVVFQLPRPFGGAREPRCGRPRDQMPLGWLQPTPPSAILTRCFRVRCEPRRPGWMVDGGTLLFQQ